MIAVKTKIINLAKTVFNINIDPELLKMGNNLGNIDDKGDKVIITPGNNLNT